MFGPDLVRRHIEAHQVPQRRAVIGYAWGYEPDLEPTRGLEEALEQNPPEVVLERYRDRPSLHDIRHPELEQYDFELERVPLPWRLFFTINCSFHREDYWGAGGSDEGFLEWGGEDQELALRLERHGLTLHFLRDAWVIEWPHERDMAVRWPQYLRT